MVTATKIYGALGGVAALFTLIGSLYLVSDTYATDVEVEEAAQKVVQVHEADQVTNAEARKNDRIDRVDRDIRKLKRLIEFGPASEKAYNESELSELNILRQNIVEGHR